jgi:hypothetical protein
MATLTGASCIITIAIPGLFNSPVQLQGFAADDVFDADTQEIAETSMGVDGILSGGFVHVPVKQTIALQADSASNLIFETWAAQQKATLDTYTANGTSNIKSTGRSYVMNKGFLTSFPSIPAVKKLLQPRRYTITWESIRATPN